MPHTAVNKAIIRYFKQEATKKDNLKHLLYLLPYKNLKRLSVINNANNSDLLVQGCGKSVYVCVCVWGGGGRVCGVCIYSKRFRRSLAEKEMVAFMINIMKRWRKRERERER